MKNGIHSFASVYYEVDPTYEQVQAMAVNFFAYQLASQPCQCGAQSTGQPGDQPDSDCFLDC